MIFCVYALVSPRRPLRAATGITGEPLRLVRAGAIAAVIGELPRRPAASTRTLKRYAAVVEAIAATVPAILPVRFGTTFADPSELAVVLRARRATIRQCLRAVRGRVQMTIRLLCESESGDGSCASQSQVTDRARVRLEHKATQGTQYLQQRARQAREVPELASIRAGIRRLVKDERVVRRAGIVTVHHLVARGQAGRYRAIVEHLADEHRVRLTVGGPWAPYAFADNW